MKHAKEEKKTKSPKILSLLLCIVISVASLHLFTKYLGEGEKIFLKSFYPLKFSEYVETSAEKYDLDKELVYAVIKTESNFDINAESHAGAKGLMQIMPKSFKWLQDLRNEKLDENQLFNPEINIDYGCYLLKYFMDVYEEETSAVAAYNAGFVVSDWLNNKEYSADGKTLEVIPYEETSNYVKKVENAKKMYINLYNGEN